MTLHQAWPSFFLSMPNILEKPWTLRIRINNSNKTSPSKTVGKNGLFEQVSCHNPNFATRWSFVLEVRLNAGKKPLTEYFQKRMKAMMTSWKTMVTMETVVVRNQLEKSNSMISWTKNGVSSCHPKKNQTTQWNQMKNVWLKTKVECY